MNTNLQKEIHRTEQRSQQAAELAEKLPDLYTRITGKFITVFTRCFYWTLCWARPVQSTQSHSISLRFVLILKWHLRLDLSFSCFQTQISIPSIRFAHLMVLSLIAFMFWSIYISFQLLRLHGSGYKMTTQHEFNSMLMESATVYLGWTIQAFRWRDWRKPRESSIRIAGVLCWDLNPGRPGCESGALTIWARHYAPILITFSEDAIGAASRSSVVSAILLLAVLSLCCSLVATDPHPYSTTSRIRILFILISTI
jgi:hypothetical protein